MTEKKGIGETMLGWFIERDGDKEPKQPQPEPAPADEEAPAARPQPIELKGELPVPAGPQAALDFAAVYRAAGISEEAQDRVSKAMNLLGTLPADASPEVKRQIVEAALKAFGYPVEQIVEASAAELQALNTFIEFSERNTQKQVAEANDRIEALTREIAEVKSLIEEKLGGQRQLTDQCDLQRVHVQSVLEFFVPNPPRTTSA